MISIKKEQIFGEDRNLCVRYSISLMILLLKSRRSKFLMKIIEACRDDLKTHTTLMTYSVSMKDFRFRRYAKTMLLNALSNENILESYKSVRKQSTDHVYL